MCQTLKTTMKIRQMDKDPIGKISETRKFPKPTPLEEITPVFLVKSEF